MKRNVDRTKVFGRITFAAIATFGVGVIIGSLTGSTATIGAFAGLAVLIFASNLLLLREGDW